MLELLDDDGSEGGDVWWKPDEETSAAQLFARQHDYAGDSETAFGQKGMGAFAVVVRWRGELYGFFGEVVEFICGRWSFG